MKQIEIFINLTRLNKPIGFMLLFWPCSWSLAYSYYLNQNIDLFIYHLLLFFLGSVLMRSAGCIFNDIVDRDFDKKVHRTKNRPIASGKISVKKKVSKTPKKSLSKEYKSFLQKSKKKSNPKKVITNFKIVKVFNINL